MLFSRPLEGVSGRGAVERLSVNQEHRQSSFYAGRASRPMRLGVVSFLNARPLIEGLREACDCQIVYQVPSRLAGLLDEDRVDAASVPVVDYFQRQNAWEIVSDACIASDGPTWTVRVFSHVPPRDLRVLHVDGDSHTSVVLAQVLWSGYWRRPIKTRPLSELPRPEEAEAVLLIGDKVVAALDRGFAYDVDLGSAWQRWTGLPMVFALWVAHRDSATPALARRLAEARDRGVARAAEIARLEAAEHGWPSELAERYLTQILQYRITGRHHEGMRRFREEAARLGLFQGEAAADGQTRQRVLTCPP